MPEIVQNFVGTFQIFSNFLQISKYKITPFPLRDRSDYKVMMLRLQAWK